MSCNTRRDLGNSHHGRNSVAIRGFSLGPKKRSLTTSEELRKERCFWPSQSSACHRALPAVGVYRVFPHHPVTTICAHGEGEGSKARGNQTGTDTRRKGLALGSNHKTVFHGFCSRTCLTQTESHSLTCRKIRGQR